MSDEQINPPLPAADQAYLDSKGATPLPEAVEKPEPAPEAKPEPKAPDEPRTVPLPLYLQTRDEAKEAKRLAAELQAKWEKMEAKFNTPEPALPDPEADPVAALKALTGEFQRLKGETAEQARQRQQAEQQQAMQREFLVRYQAAAAEFAQAKPDFMAAYSHLRADRAAELAAMGFAGPQAQHILEQEEFGIAAQAFQQGRNPAEVMYALAARRGYKAAEAKPEPKAPDLATIAKGQQAAGTLSGSGSAAPPDLTLESVANMSTDEFEAWIAEPKNAKKWDSLKRGLA